MKKTLMGLIAALLAATSVSASDVYQPDPISDAPPPVAVGDTSGWYLRGDVGYAFNKLDGAYFYQGSNDNRRDFDSSEMDDAFVLGGGVGYQMNNYLRSDLTFDYMFRSGFDGSTSGSGADFGACVGACTSRDVASLTAFSLLANAYVDIGTWGAITPYVGAGIGGTYVKWKDLKNTSCSDANPAFCDDPVTHDGGGNWRFTYALMAGASIDMTCNLKADIGYRYRNVDGGKMFGYKSNSGPGYDKGFDSHEVRAGLRYVFAGCEQPYIAPEDPIVYK